MGKVKKGSASNKKAVKPADKMIGAAANKSADAEEGEEKHG